MFFSQQERRRLKERYPSLALINKDKEQCGLMLNNYEELLQSRSICEGRCALGEECPTGVCRSKTQKRSRRSSRAGRSQSEMTRSPSTTSTSSTSSLRPRSGPAGLRSYTGWPCFPTLIAAHACACAWPKCSRMRFQRRKWWI